MTTDPVNCKGEHKNLVFFTGEKLGGNTLGQLQSPSFLAIMCNVVKTEDFQIIYKCGMQTTEGAKYFPTPLKERWCKEEKAG